GWGRRGGGGGEGDGRRGGGVGGDGVAEHVEVAIALRQAVGERLPRIAGAAAAEGPQLGVGREVLAITLDGDDVDGFRLVGVHVDDEAEVGGQVAADFLPVVAGVVTTHDIPVLLHEKHARTRGMHGDVVHAVSDFSVGIGNV